MAPKKEKTPEKLREEILVKEEKIHDFAGSDRFKEEIEAKQEEHEHEDEDEVCEDFDDVDLESDGLGDNIDDFTP